MKWLSLVDLISGKKKKKSISYSDRKVGGNSIFLRQVASIIVDAS